MAFTLTILDDANHSATVSKQTLGRAGEAGEVITVVTPSSLYNLGYDAYLHFLLPDGTPVYKGSYPCASASFTVTIGATDNILALEGTIIMQFVLINGTAYIWKSEEKRLDVVSAVNATAPATALDYLYVQIPTTYVSGNLMGYDSTTHKAVDLGYAVDPDLVGVATPTSFTNGNIATYNPTTQRIVDSGRAITDFETGWIVAGETWTYASASTFTVAADVSAKYGKGDKIKLTQTTAKYFYVISAVYSAPNTTVTVTAGTSYTIANAAITLPYYSHEANPFGFPDWFNFTPVAASNGTMTFGTITYSHCVFRVSGKTCTYSIGYANGTTGGTAATGITFTLPIASTAAYNSGTGWTYDGAEQIGIASTGISTTIVTVQKADLTVWGIGGTKIVSLNMTYPI